MYVNNLLRGHARRSKPHLHSKELVAPYYFVSPSPFVGKHDWTYLILPGRINAGRSITRNPCINRIRITSCTKINLRAAFRGLGTATDCGLNGAITRIPALGSPSSVFTVGSTWERSVVLFVLLEGDGCRREYTGVVRRTSNFGFRRRERSLGEPGRLGVCVDGGRGLVFVLVCGIRRLFCSRSGDRSRGPSGSGGSRWTACLW